jgi:heptosyltransferase-3
MTSVVRIKLPERPRVLVVTLRRIGDVLLTTPLIRSLRRAWPEATIDALVFADTAGILAGNPDLDDIVTIPPQPSTAQTLRLGAWLFRDYDLAVSTQSGDRPTGFAIAAGRARGAGGGKRERPGKGSAADPLHRRHAGAAPRRGNVAAR